MEQCSRNQIFKFRATKTDHNDTMVGGAHLPTDLRDLHGMHPGAASAAMVEAIIRDEKNYSVHV